MINIKQGQSRRSSVKYADEHFSIKKGFFEAHGHLGLIGHGFMLTPALVDVQIVKTSVSFKS